MWLLCCGGVCINIARSWNYKSPAFVLVHAGTLAFEGGTWWIWEQREGIKTWSALQAEALCHCKIFSFVLLLCCPEDLISCFSLCGSLFWKLVESRGFFLESKLSKYSDFFFCVVFPLSWIQNSPTWNLIMKINKWVNKKISEVTWRQRSSFPFFPPQPASSFT